METRAHYVIIGTVVLVAIAGALLFVLMISQNRAEFEEYDIVFRDRVSGLTKGAPVRFNGIQKGEVYQLTIDPDDPSIVVARIRVESDTPVKEDTRAELELVGFTGLAVIQLVGGGKDARNLKDMQRGVPQIEADASGLAAFLEGSGDIVASANRLLSVENTEAVAKILRDFSSVTGAVAAEEASIRETLRNAATLTDHLADTAEELARAADGLDALINDDAPQTLVEARVALREASTLMKDLQAVVEENREPLAVFTDQGLAQVAPMIAEARRTFHTLDQVLREVDRDPRGYILGQSTPRYEGAQQ